MVGRRWRISTSTSSAVGRCHSPWANNQGLSSLRKRGSNSPGLFVCSLHCIGLVCIIRPIDPLSKEVCMVTDRPLVVELVLGAIDNLAHAMDGLEKDKAEERL